MNRPTGVTITAVLSAAGSALALLMIGFMVVTAILGHLNPARPKLGVAMSVIVFLAQAIWGGITTVGLWRVRPWARLSLLVFCGLVMVMALMAMASTALIPIPTPAGTSDEVLRMTRFGIMAFCGVFVVLAAAWLLYFNSASIRSQFAGTGESTEGGRPVSVTIIAAWMLVTGVTMLGIALVGFPAMTFGIVFTGVGARLYNLAMSALYIWCGVGLLRLQPVSRVIGIGMWAYTILNSLVFFVLPNHAEVVQEMMSDLPQTFRTPGFEPTIPNLPLFSLLSVSFSAVPIWLLITRHKAFAQPANV